MEVFYLSLNPETENISSLLHNVLYNTKEVNTNIKLTLTLSLK